MKAFRTLRAAIASFMILAVLIFAGCNNPATQNEQAGAADSIPAQVTLSPEATGMLYSFPTPFEVTNLLEKAKAGFIFDITNPPANTAKYTTEMSKALNLGVYSADLSYSATYNRTDETNQFLAATTKLAEELGIAGVYDQSLPEEVKKFSNNKDSLVSLITRIFTRTNEFLSSNNRTQVAVLIAAGGFAEGMYLAASLAEVAKDNTKIIAVIAGQRDNHMKLLTILEAYQGKEEMKTVTDGIARLKPIWGNYDIESGKKMAQEKVVEISGLTESVRNSFVQ